MVFQFAIPNCKVLILQSYNNWVSLKEKWNLYIWNELIILNLKNLDTANWKMLDIQPCLVVLWSKFNRITFTPNTFPLMPPDVKAWFIPVRLTFCSPSLLTRTSCLQACAFSIGEHWFNISKIQPWSLHYFV